MVGNNVSLRGMGTNATLILWMGGAWQVRIQGKP